MDNAKKSNKKVTVTAQSLTIMTNMDQRESFNHH